MNIKCGDIVTLDDWSYVMVLYHGTLRPYHHANTKEEKEVNTILSSSYFKVIAIQTNGFPIDDPGGTGKKCGRVNEIMAVSTIDSDVFIFTLPDTPVVTNTKDNKPSVSIDPIRTGDCVKIHDGSWSMVLQNGTLERTLDIAITKPNRYIVIASGIPGANYPTNKSYSFYQPPDNDTILVDYYYKTRIIFTQAGFCTKLPS
jgi:hypothetical protein